MAVIWLAELTVKLLAAVPPKETAVDPVKLLPEMITEVPPVRGPALTFRAVTTGSAKNVN